MTLISSHISNWVKLTILGFTFGGGYFVVQDLKANRQWWVLSLLVLFTAFTVLFLVKEIKRCQHGVLGILLVLCVLMALYTQHHISMFYVVICLLAIETRRRKVAIIWVGLCVLAVFGSELSSSISLVNLQDAIVNSLLTLFISGFAFLRIEAETARSHTRDLLHELENKNLQLASYADEREWQSRREERQHLSRELHDTLGHKLTTSLVQLEAAKRFLEQDPERTKEILQTTHSLLKEGLDETRNIVRLIDTNTLEQQSLTEAISQLVSHFQVATELCISLQLECNETLIPIRCKRHLLRIVQEALTNISRHADASDVTIILTVNDVIVLRIEDNGVRLNNYQGESLPTLKTIESRVAELRGSLNFFREADLTRLHIEVPVSRVGGPNAY